jgi:4'-phosphopantetheinyl transferase EntD
MPCDAPAKAPYLPRLLPPIIVACEGVVEDWLAPVYDDELESLPGASPSRIREFVAGRNCARSALRLIGRVPRPIPVREDRQPDWPRGVCGSITHGAGYCAAAVALTQDVRAIGIDVEHNCTLGTEMLDAVCSAAEQEHWPKAGACKTFNWDIITFSAKESFYKCYFPIARYFLDFRDVEVFFDAINGSFTARPARDIVPFGNIFPLVRGSFAVADTRIMSAAWLPPSL